MADTVSTKVLQNDNYTYAIQIMNLCDGTGESNVVKTDKSGLVAPDGAEPSALTLLSANWVVTGFTRVSLAWDHTTDIPILNMVGVGGVELEHLSGMKDPGTGGAGDVLLTTVGNVAGDTYSIVLVFRKDS